MRHKIVLYLKNWLSFGKLITGSLKCHKIWFLNEPATYIVICSFLTKSKTIDLSDLVDILKPTVDDLDLYGYTAEELIVSCSFDKKNCSHRHVIYIPKFPPCTRSLLAAFCFIVRHI